MASEQIRPWQPHRWLLFAAVAVAALTVLPIGIHTVLLDNLGVPYPADLPKVGLALVPDHALLIAGMIGLDRALRQMSGIFPGRRWAALFLIVAAVNQAVFRLPVMRNVVSTRWTIYPFVDNLPSVFWYAIAAFLVVLIGRRASSLRRGALAAGAFAITLDLLVAPGLASVFAPIIASNSAREGDQLYRVPYDWHVDLPSYITFAEPAFGALAAAMILRKWRAAPRTIVALVFAIQGGPLFRVILNFWYAHLSPPLAMLSEGQFTLQAVALAALAAFFAGKLIDPEHAI